MIPFWSWPLWAIHFKGNRKNGYLLFSSSKMSPDAVRISETQSRKLLSIPETHKIISPLSNTWLTKEFYFSNWKMSIDISDIKLFSYFWVNYTLIWVLFDGKSPNFWEVFETVIFMDKLDFFTFVAIKRS